MATEYARLTLSDESGRQISSRLVRVGDEEYTKSLAAAMAQDMVVSALARKLIGVAAQQYSQRDAETMKKQTVIMHDGAWGEW